MQVQIRFLRFKLKLIGVNFLPILIKVLMRYVWGGLGDRNMLFIHDVDGQEIGGQGAGVHILGAKV